MWLFKRKKRYANDVVELVENYHIDADDSNDYIPSIVYSIKRVSDHITVGRCDLRIGMDKMLYYAGSIGYHINEAYRGHSYAYYACLIMFDLAKNNYHLDSLIITCNPDNVASRKTCERLGGTLKEIVDIPDTHWLYKQGDTQKCIFEYKL